MCCCRGLQLFPACHGQSKLWTGHKSNTRLINSHSPSKVSNSPNMHLFALCVGLLHSGLLFHLHTKSQTHDTQHLAQHAARKTPYTGMYCIKYITLTTSSSHYHTQHVTAVTFKCNILVLLYPCLQIHDTIKLEKV